MEQLNQTTEKIKTLKAKFDMISSEFKFVENTNLAEIQREFLTYSEYITEIQQNPDDYYNLSTCLNDINNYFDQVIDKIDLEASHKEIFVPGLEIGGKVLHQPFSTIKIKCLRKEVKRKLHARIENMFHFKPSDLEVEL